MGLKRFEERLERLVEGSLTRPFRSSLQPVEIGRRLTREMDLQRRVGPRGQLVATNAFTVTLSPADVERFSSYVDALVRELAEAAREHAELESYVLLGPVEVDIFESSRTKAGQITVEARVIEGMDVLDVVLPDGRRIRPSATPIVLGRDPGCDVVLNDPNVSRHHAQIALIGEDLVVTDMNSTNGTTLNGVPISSATAVAGDVIAIGTSRLDVVSS